MIALASRLFDVWTMLLFGILGFVLRKFHYPVAPLVILLRVPAVNRFITGKRAAVA